MARQPRKDGGQAISFHLTAEEVQGIDRLAAEWTRETPFGVQKVSRPQIIHRAIARLLEEYPETPPEAPEGAAEGEGAQGE